MIFCTQLQNRYCFYFVTETRTNFFVTLNDVRQTETSIHFKQNGRYVRKMTETIMDQECIDTTDALNFNNLAIGAENATNPIVKKLLMLNYLLFLIVCLNIC
jgi:hypothetical protein